MTDRAHPILEIRNLAHTYGDGTRALDGVSLSLPAGGRIALVGPNGSGKTTLLLHLNGLLPIQAGEIRIDDRKLTKSDLGHARRSVGLLFQDPDDQSFMPTLIDDVSFGPLNMGLDSDMALVRAREALATVGLEGKEDKAPQVLSGGQKRLAALAGLLAMEPKLLALDEPTSGLDPRARRGLEERLKGASQALLVASHDLEFCLTLCDEAVVLEDGKVTGSGPICEIFGDRDFMEFHGLERPHSLDHLQGMHVHERPPGPCG